MKDLTEAQFPILDGGGPHAPKRTIPWGLLAPHERQAQINHGGQSLKRLAERGGLGPCEAVAVIEDRRWFKMHPERAEQLLRGYISAYQTGFDAGRAALQAREEGR